MARSEDEEPAGHRVVRALPLGTLFPSHTSDHRLPFHTQREGSKGGSAEVSPSPQAQRDTGHFALSPQPQVLGLSTAAPPIDHAKESPADPVKCGFGLSKVWS